MKNIVFQIDGGIGKVIASTSVAKAIKKKYPNDNLIIISGYPEVYLNNPNVYKSLQFGNISYFYTDYIENKEALLFLHNPYLEVDYVQENKHLIQVWCEMFDLEYNGEMPEIYLTKRELDFYQHKYKSDKPLFLMQTNGGASADIKYSFARDLPIGIVEKVIERYKNDFNIVHVRREDQIGYANTTPIHAHFREILALTLLTSKRLLIDSFLQHACASMGLKSSVCWITNSPKVLGYELHDNILANPFTHQPELKNSYLSKFNIGGDPIEFPYKSEDDIFDIEKIFASLDKQK
jgi:hypothetical protein